VMLNQSERNIAMAIDINGIAMERYAKDRQGVLFIAFMVLICHLTYISLFKRT